MVNEIFEKNMEVLKEKYIDLYNKILTYKSENENVIIDESIQGEPIIAVNNNNHFYYLNSRYNDEEYTQKWISQFNEIKFKQIFVIYGVSNFSCIKALSEKIDKSNIIMVYEPNLEIFIKAISIKDITEIISNDNILISARGGNDQLFEEFLLFILNYSNINNFKCLCMLNYEKLYGDIWNEMLEAIKNRYRSVIAGKKFKIECSDELIENYLSGCEDAIEQSSLNILGEEFRKKDNIGDMPVVIVSAGPSLNKNVKDLKELEDKVFIIAVDTALKTLLNNDIVPDLAVTIDPHKDLILFAHKYFKDIPIITYGGGNKGLKYMHSGKRFYFDFPYAYMSYMYEKIKKEKMQATETGGSVANNAFSVAMILGFKKIILIGQDLSYPDKKGHVMEAYEGAEENIDEFSKQYFEVEDVYGNMVLTESSMDVYRRWFETEIVRYPLLEVIDATEGGAKIKGTEIMTLKEAIQRECKIKPDKSFISEIGYSFTEKEKEELRQELDDIDEKLEKIKSEINRGIRKYEKMEELFRKNKAGTKEFKTIIGEIDEIVKMTEEDPLMYLVKMYTATDEYEVMENVYEVKKEIKEEIRDIVDKGIKMFNSYIRAIGSLKTELTKRRQFDGKEFNAMLEEVNKNICKLEEKISVNDVVGINKVMKEFYNIIVKPIDVQYRINREYYKLSEDLLRKVTEKYIDKEYLNMFKVIKEQMLKNFKEFSQSMEDKIG